MARATSAGGAVKLKCCSASSSRMEVTFCRFSKADPDAYEAILARERRD